MNTSDLIDDILVRFHTPLHRDLPRLVADARERDGEPGWPAGLSDHVARMREEIDSHLAKEEMVLFPMIRMGRGAVAHGPISVMLTEHDDHTKNLGLLRELTNNFTPVEGASEAARTLYAELGALEADLLEHIRVENESLFPGALRGL